MTLRTRGVVRLISYFTALVLVLSGFLIESRRETAALKAEARRGSRRAYQELVASLEVLDASLLKTTAARTPAMIGKLASEAARRAGIAAARLAELPGTGRGSDRIVDYLNRAAEKTGQIADAAARGKLPGEKERKELASLRAISGEILSSFSERAAYIYEETFFDDLPEEADPDSLPETAKGSFAGAVSALNGEFPGPDGAGKESSGKQAAALELPEVNEEEAREYAASLFGLPREAAIPAGEGGEEIPYYEFHTENGETGTIRVAKNGGKLLSYAVSGETGGSRLSPGEAVKEAKAFLKKAGYGGAAEGVMRRESGVLYVSFAPEQNGARLYPDEIRLGVSLEDGRIVAADASGFLRSHRERELPDSFGEAYEPPELADGFRCVGSRPALIAAESGEETPCFEIRTADRDGNGFLCYLNAESGEEEKILLISEEDGCFLTY